MILSVFVFACVGIAFEVAFTAVTDVTDRRSIRLRGHSYLWMAPVYALVPVFLAALYPALHDAPLPARLAIYVTILYAVEYASGWILRRLTGVCPWDYRDKGLNIHGLIRLDYAPFWALACFLFEALFLALRT